MKYTAKWLGRVLAESDHVELVEGNLYFPPESLAKDFFQPSQQTSVCPWKGNCKYYNIVVDGKVNQGAAWFYPDPKLEAKNIKGHVAFWKGVEIVKGK